MEIVNSFFVNDVNEISSLPNVSRGRVLGRTAGPFNEKGTFDEKKNDASPGSISITKFIYHYSLDIRS